MRSFELGPFLGPVTALDPRAIDEHHAADVSNYRYEDGKLLPRYGYRNLFSAVSSFSSVHGFDRADGYNASNALVSEYLAFFRKSSDTAGKCRPYFFAVNTSTEALTAAVELTNGGSAAEVSNTGDWRIFAWRQFAYCCNPNETNSVYRHTLGTTTSFTALTYQDAPSTAMGYTITLGGSNTPYTTLSWTGLDPTSSSEMACTGIASNTGSSLANGVIRVRHTTSAIGQASVTFDMSLMNANTQDWTYNDCFRFPFGWSASTPFRVDPNSIAISFINADGSPLTFAPSRVIITQFATNSFAVSVYFDTKVRADWDNVKKIAIAYNVIAGASAAADTEFYVFPPYIGGVWMLPINATEADYLEFGYSYYDSTTTFEGEIGAVVKVPFNVLGCKNVAGANPGLGVQLQLTGIASNANVDKTRIYVRLSGGDWYRITTQDDTTATYTYRATDAETRISANLYTPGTFQTTNCIAGFPFKGWVVWLYKGGYQNVKHSRVATPEQQYSTHDDPADMNQGAHFSLADNQGDEPLAGFQAGDAAIIVGNVGVYAQVGDRPLTMTPCKKLPGSFGAPNAFAACRFTLDGVPGVAALSKGGEGIYFYAVDDSFDGVQGFRVQELTASIRPSLKDFLLTPQSLTNYSTAILVAEPNTDALWLIVGKRAVVLRKPSLVDGNRYWDFYQYTMASATVSYANTSVRGRMKWVRSDGKVDENEYRFDTGAYISGSTRDGGSAMPASSIYWTSKVFRGERRRVYWVEFVRGTSTNTPQVQIISSDASNTLTVASGSTHVKTTYTQTGEEHQFKIIGAEGDDVINRVIVEESVPIGVRRVV